MEMRLFSPAQLGPLELGNRMVMAPPTRCRALGNVSNTRMAEHYAQRAGFGLIDAERVEADIQAWRGDLIAFGRAALANPNLPERLRTGAALNDAVPDTFYMAGPEGYTHYPTLKT